MNWGKPCLVLVLMKQALGKWFFREVRVMEFSSRSILLKTRMLGLSWAPSSSMTFNVVLI